MYESGKFNKLNTKGRNDISLPTNHTEEQEQITPDQSLIKKISEMQKEIDTLKKSQSSLLYENLCKQSIIDKKTEDLNQSLAEKHQLTELLDKKASLIHSLKQDVDKFSTENKELSNRIEEANAKQSIINKESVKIKEEKDKLNKKRLENQLIVPSPKKENDYISTLNEEQKEAVLFNGKHLLVVAGAGTGKTRTIIARALHLVKTGTNPKRILILSFTRKSAAEIVNRIKDNLKGNSFADDLKGQTFHSWCMELIKGNPAFKDYSDWTLLDEEDRISAVKLICGRNLKDDEGNKITPSGIIEIYSYMLNTLCNLSEALRVKRYDNCPKEIFDKEPINETRNIFSEFLKKYVKYKRSKHYLDYDDLLKIVADGLEKNIKARDFVSSLYDHILVDEMQDTNPLQYKLLSAFYEKSHLYCVGDDAQSIYAFRGADFKTMHNFTEIVLNSEIKKLTINYRSTQEVLDISNWLLSQSHLNYNKRLTAYRGKGNLPYFIHAEDNYEEADNITDKIKKVLVS